MKGLDMSSYQIPARAFTAAGTIALMLATGALAGCGGDPPTTTTTTRSVTTDTAAPVMPQQQTTTVQRQTTVGTP
jgi:hypothetical protein